MSYDALIKRAEGARRGGIHSESSRLYWLASVEAFKTGSLGDASAARNQAAVSARLAGCPGLAEDYFVDAMEFADQLPESSGKWLAVAEVACDWAMLRLDQQDFAAAANMLDQAVVALRQVAESQDRLSIIKGFRGRMYFLRNLKADRKIARRLLQEAYAELEAGAHPEWTLDALVWLLRASNPVQRLFALPDALKLAREVGSRQRLHEVQIICLGGETAYRVVKRAYTHFR